MAMHAAVTQHGWGFPGVVPTRRAQPLGWPHLSAGTAKPGFVTALGGGLAPGMTSRSKGSLLLVRRPRHATHVGLQDLGHPALSSGSWESTHSHTWAFRVETRFPKSTGLGGTGRRSDSFPDPYLQPGSRVRLNFCVLCVSKHTHRFMALGEIYSPVARTRKTGPDASITQKMLPMLGLR